jgi:hypothetical protein
MSRRQSLPPCLEDEVRTMLGWITPKAQAALIDNPDTAVGYMSARDPDLGAGEDEAWFEANRGRRHRVRLTEGVEREKLVLVDGLEPGDETMILIRRVAPYRHLVVPLVLRAGPPLDLDALGEDVLATLFDCVLEARLQGRQPDLTEVLRRCGFLADDGRKHWA